MNPNYQVNKKKTTSTTTTTTTPTNISASNIGISSGISSGSSSGISSGISSGSGSNANTNNTDSTTTTTTTTTTGRRVLPRTELTMSFLEIQQEALLLQQQQQRCLQQPNHQPPHQRTAAAATTTTTAANSASNNNHHNNDNNNNSHSYHRSSISSTSTTTNSTRTSTTTDIGNSRSHINSSNSRYRPPLNKSTSTSRSTSRRRPSNNNNDDNDDDDDNKYNYYYYGTIVSLKKDFGFISYRSLTTTTTMGAVVPDNDDEQPPPQIFFHISSIVAVVRSDTTDDSTIQYTNKTFDQLSIDEEVEFCIKTTTSTSTSKSTGRGGDSEERKKPTTSMAAIQVRTVTTGTTKQQYEHQQLQQAPIEYGRIVQLCTTEYGYLLSTSRSRLGTTATASSSPHQPIYFSYNHITSLQHCTTTTTTIDDDDGTNNEQEQQEPFVLKEGQNVQFLVIQEDIEMGQEEDAIDSNRHNYSATSSSSSTSTSNRQRRYRQRRLAARQIQMIPMNDPHVIFSTPIAYGVTGIVTKVPQPQPLQSSDTTTTTSNYNTNSSSSSRWSVGKSSADSSCVASGALESFGKLYLHDTITTTSTLSDKNCGSSSNNDNDNNDATIRITEVFLSPEDSPGGQYTAKSNTGTSNSSRQQHQSQQSSSFLYIELGDVLLFDIVQDTCDLAYRAVPTKYRLPKENQINNMTENDTVAAATSDTGITTTTLDQQQMLLPQSKKNVGGVKDDIPEATTDEVAAAVRLIQLSLAGRAEGTISAIIKDMYGFIQHAERSVDVHFKLSSFDNNNISSILPNHIQDDIRYYMSMTTSKESSNSSMIEPQLEIGTQVQFDLSIAQQGSNSTPTTDREQLKAQRMVLLPPNTFTTSMSVVKNVTGKITQQDKIQPYCGTVESNFVDVDMTPSSLLPLSIRRRRHPLIVEMLESYIRQIAISSPNDIPPIEYRNVQSMKEVNTILELVEIIGKGQLAHSYIPIPYNQALNYPGRLVIQANAADHIVTVETDSPSDVTSDPKKEEQVDTTIKNVRYDTKSYSEDFRNDVPASIGDLVECDVVQCRRTGQWRVENMKITERSSISDIEFTVTKQDVNGTIKDVMKNCGFINVLDENFKSKKQEVIMFMIDVSSNGDSEKRQQFRKGDPVRFDIKSATGSGRRIAVNVISQSKISGKHSNQQINDKNICLGLVLLEPSLTTLKNTPIRKASSNVSTAKNSRWDTVDDDRNKSSSDDIVTNLGCIVLTSDPAGVFQSTHQPATLPSTGDTSSTTIADDTILSKSSGEVVERSTGADTGLYQHLRYKLSSLSLHQPGAMMTDVAKSLTPRRGDLVSFVKIKSSKPTSSNTNKNSSTDIVIRELRLMTKSAASLIRGKLEWLTPAAAASGSDSNNNSSDGKGNDTSEIRMIRFVMDDEPRTAYTVGASEIVSCDPSWIKDQECVEGILYEGKLYGIARITDLYIESKYNNTAKSGKATTGTSSGITSNQRPKLNLTVKKDLGGKIVAQSMMAKGPDGISNGFVSGWTHRTSRFVTLLAQQQQREQEQAEAETNKTTSSGSGLKVDAPEFTPTKQPAKVIAPVTKSDTVTGGEGG